MIRYVTIKTSLEDGRHYDPKHPWLIVLEDNGVIRMDRQFGKFASHSAAKREVRELVAEWKRKRSA
ncbi:hypothetical protein GA0061099_102141 [Bradyrhizobium yuanmingense]|uniref:Uncharacterized protein n=1 Tax=Bradyrhizobium yuanmingense TaxID=108015 RepID=A0A1C3XHK0_9BRAD|nr:hypothetical protein [Bradyrhizobium yuanmingense]TWI18952.1 hypothetical protein IQ15_06976 [Bradyrhizobium yuanmingense]SCB51761.1 hypothetical protein GA0061099_102141 [Bradyrhizobium yuanmingense]